MPRLRGVGHPRGIHGITRGIDRLGRHGGGHRHLGGRSGGWQRRRPHQGGPAGRDRSAGGSADPDGDRGVRPRARWRGGTGVGGAARRRAGDRQEHAPDAGCGPGRGRGADRALREQRGEPPADPASRRSPSGGGSGRSGEPLSLHRDQSGPDRRGDSAGEARSGAPRLDPDGVPR